MPPVDLGVVPPEGLALCSAPGCSSDSESDVPAQVLRLALSPAIVDELIASLRANQKARIRLGKTPALSYGHNYSQSQAFKAYAEEFPSEIYMDSGPSEANNVKDGSSPGLYFSGLLSHKLEVQKAREDTATTDQALATLKQQLGAYERGKQSKKTPMITTVDEMHALGAGDKRSLNRKRPASLARLPTSRIDAEKERFFKNTSTRSASGSPTPPTPGLPTTTTPISSTPLEPNKDKIRFAALRVPFLHLLAIRPASADFLVEKTRSPRNDILELVRKYATENRADRSKLDLRDKAYKELDVWNFPYPSQEDRQAAIENAISAFDRMRLSKSDKLWQHLLPKAERNQGKVLSRLNINVGPLVKPQRAPQVRGESKEGDAIGNESDKLSGTATPAMQSAPKKPTEKRSKTLTGRVTKKTEKAPPKNDKVKSAEFVHDSDEDMEMLDVHNPPRAHPQPEPHKVEAGEKQDHGEKQATPATSDTKPGPRTKQGISVKHDPSKAESEEKQERPINSETKAESKEKQAKPTKSKPQAVEPKTKQEGPAKSGPAKTKLKEPSKQSLAKSSPIPPPRERVTKSSAIPQQQPLAEKQKMASKNAPPSRPSSSKSPPKQSVSGCPPAVTKAPSTSSTASSASSSSSSPLINQVRKNPTTVTSAPRVSPSVAKSMPASTNTKPGTNSLKRKAPETRPSINVTTAAQPAGASPPKRQRSSTPSSAGGTTETSSSGSPLSREVARKQLLEKSSQFKRNHAKYRALHMEVSQQADPPEHKLFRLDRQHKYLQRMKNEIWEEHRRLYRVGS